LPRAPCQVAHHRATFGSNKLPSRKVRAYLSHLFDAVNDVVLISLLIASVVMIAYGGAMSKQVADLLQGVGILFAVVIVSTVNSYQSWRQDQQFSEMVDLKADRLVAVLRDHQERTISVLDLVVGDVMLLRPGEVLPCDGLYLTGFGLRCDESAATGEAYLVPKGADNVFFIGGAKVMAGSGAMLVLSVGANSTYGKIQATLEDLDPPPTPLQDKLEALATKIGYGGLASGVAVFLVLTIAYLKVFYPLYSDAFKAILSFFIMGVTLIVVAVPEGLPLALTLTLVSSLRTMVKEKVLVKELATVELLGGVTSIVVDKSGTLSEGQMTVGRGWFFGTFADAVPDVGRVMGTPRRDLLARLVALNTEATIKYTPEAVTAFRRHKPQGVTATGGPAAVAAAEVAISLAMADCDITGAPTEAALLHMLRMDFDLDYAFIRKTHGSFVYREAFTPARLKCTTVYGPASPAGSVAPLRTISEGGSADGGTAMGNPGSGAYTVFVIGAPEAVLPFCAFFLNAEGQAIPMETRRRDALNGVVDVLAGRGLRPLALATRSIDPQHAPAGHLASPDVAAKSWASAMRAGNVESGLTLLAVVGLRDLLRKGLVEAVESAAAGGIKVRLATGEHPACAKLLAEDVGIYRDGVVLDGHAWRNMSPDDRSAVLPRLEVLARATPADKMLLVDSLKEAGEVVMACGSATEDAATMSKVAVPCAMGSRAAEVCKAEAQVIFIEGGLASMTRSVLWGRSVLENVRKFLTFQFTVNFVAVSLTLFGAFYNAYLWARTSQPPFKCPSDGTVKSIPQCYPDSPFPLESIQLLWVNLIMDAFGALMLATEAPDAELMRMRPNDRALPLITRTMIKHVLLVGVAQLAVLIFLAVAGSSVFLLPADGTRKHFTAVFNTFVWMQIGNYFNARRVHDQRDAGYLLHGLRAAGFGLGLLASIALLQILFVEAGSSVFKTELLDAGAFLIGAGIGVGVSLLVGLVARFVPFGERDLAPLPSRASARVAPGDAEGSGTPYKPWITGRTGATGSGEETTRLTRSMGAESSSPQGTVRSSARRSPRVAPSGDDE
jgi:Ca2+-transporting ATPase